MNLEEFRKATGGCDFEVISSLEDLIGKGEIKLNIIKDGKKVNLLVLPNCDIESFQHDFGKIKINIATKI